MSDEDSALYEDVFKLLERYDNEGYNFAEGQEDIIGKIRAYTGLEEDQARLVVELFFKEILNAMLRGDEVVIGGLGNFHTFNPAKYRKNKDWFHIYPKFTASPMITKKINK